MLFIERCLRFLKPGGRMAIVLPQGIFNNTSEEYIRNYVMQHAVYWLWWACKAICLASLPAPRPVFLCLQKWQDDAERIATGDYRIFFATDQKSGKDNSGEYIWLDKETGERVRDTAGKVIGEQLTLDHDLFDIVEAFKVFAREERMDFFAWSPSDTSETLEELGQKGGTAASALSGFQSGRIKTP